MSHIYRHRDGGHRLPSVTTIIPSAYDGCPKDLLEDGSRRGTYIHAATVLTDNDNLDEKSVPEEYKPFLDGYRLAVEDLKIKWVKGWRERPCHSKIIGVAGTPDGIATVGGRPMLNVIDIKSGDSKTRQMEAIWGVQTAGYELIYREVEGYKGKMGRLVLQLHSTGRYSVFPLEDPSDHAAFRSFANTYKWKMRHNIK